MKDKPCCYDCLHHERVKGISGCKQTDKKLVNPFDPLKICEEFICFQCAKHNRECNCYKEEK